MSIIKHTVGGVQYASIVEVLRELNAANVLGYNNDNYRY
jgi:hypothetical protein